MTTPGETNRALRKEIELLEIDKMTESQPKFALQKENEIEKISESFEKAEDTKLNSKNESLSQLENMWHDSDKNERLK